MRSWNGKGSLQCPECWCEEKRVALGIPPLENSNSITEVAGGNDLKHPEVGSNAEVSRDV
jgi:hypothetical protein